MCKVSTLRSVEPPCTNVFCKAEQLPKIRKLCMIKQPLVYIQEDDGGSEFSLPQLKESHPPTAVLGHVESKICHDSEPTDIVKTKMDHEDLPKCRRPSTPFVTANPLQKSPSPVSQSNASPAIPLPIDQKNILTRPKLHLSLSYPGTNDKGPKKMNNMARIPTPPKSPPKNRPSTPFLLTRSRSFDAKKSPNNLHVLDETEISVECLEKAKSLPSNVYGKKSFVARKIDRDKSDKFPVEVVPENDMFLADQNGKGRKIRMDMAAFTQWIEEHRLP